MERYIRALAMLREATALMDAADDTLAAALMSAPTEFLAKHLDDHPLPAV